MSKKEQKYYEDLLRAVDRTHLVFSKNSDAERLVGLKLTPNNGLVKKGGKDPFLKKAIFHELEMVTRQIVGDDGFSLEQLLHEYEDAYNYYKTLQRMKFFNLSLYKEEERSKQQLKIVKDLFKYLICFEERPKKLRKNISTVLDDIYSLDKGYGMITTIMILLFLDVLPSFEKGKQVIDIKAEFKVVLDFCKKYIADDPLLFNQIQDLPLYDEEINNLSDFELCRVNLIWYAYILFGRISAHTDSTSLYMANSVRKRSCYGRYYLDGIWENTENEKEFWSIKRIENSPEYIFTKWIVENNNGQNKYKYSTYLLLFNNPNQATIRGPKYVHHYVTSKRLWLNDVSYFTIEANDELKPTKLCFNSAFSKAFPFPPTLKKSKYSIVADNIPIISTPDESDKNNKFVKQENIPHFEIYDKFYCLDFLEEKIPIDPSYDYLFEPALHAVSFNAVYIFNTEDSDFRYYRIPVERDKSLRDVNMNDTSGIVWLRGKRYIAFFDQNLFFDLDEEWKLQREEDNEWDKVLKQIKSGISSKLPGERIDWITKIRDDDDWIL